jgi:hypothetical protein
MRDGTLFRRVDSRSRLFDGRDNKRRWKPPETVLAAVGVSAALWAGIIWLVDRLLL